MKKIIAIAFIITPFFSHAYTYGCYGDKVFNMSLDSSSSKYPSKGTTYDVNFGSSNDRYPIICDVPNNSNLKGTKFYKADYDKAYEMDNEYAILNDNVKVKTVIQGSLVVPFNDYNNNFTENVAVNGSPSIGSNGVITILIDKTILQGVIIVPAFSINIYNRYNITGINSNYVEPIVKVFFSESRLNVEKICDVSDATPRIMQFNDKTITSIITNTSIGNIDVNVKCEGDVSNLNLNLKFRGNQYSFNDSYFSTSNPNIGLGVGDSSNNIYINSKLYPFTVNPVANNTKLSFNLIPIMHEAKTIINGPLATDIKVEVVSDD